ncbi:hypothetical protein [Ktedonospora formicarum]|nr:hypothetical protein [Ktedonospora formicarum]
MITTERQENMRVAEVTTAAIRPCARSRRSYSGGVRSVARHDAASVGSAVVVVLPVWRGVTVTRLRVTCNGETLAESVNGFVGRGAALNVASLHNAALFAKLSIIEAVVGLLLEVVFVATILQRFFGK